MREADAVALQLDDACVERGRQSRCAADAGGVLGEGGGRVGMRRGRQEEVSTLVGKGQDAVVYERVEGLRNRQRLTSLDRGADSLQHTDDLERVERVAARGVVHLRGERPRQHGAEMALDDAVQRPCVERPHRQLGKAVRGKRPS